jgi:GNAT superfamily N-acetyltransferase
MRIALLCLTSSDPMSNSPSAIREPITFRGAAEFPDSAALILQMTPWVLAAGQPYYDWFFGGRELAERTVAMWIRQPSSEVSIQRAKFLQCGSQIAGGIIGLGGAELRKARLADINSYWATLDSPSRGGLIERLSQSVDAFAPVADDEYYASKMGLARSFLGKGLAKVMLERCLEQGSALGYTKFRADVHTENQPSLRCCLGLGFEIFYTGQSADGVLRYHALRCERKNK